VLGKAARRRLIGKAEAARMNVVEGEITLSPVVVTGMRISGPAVQEGFKPNLNSK